MDMEQKYEKVRRIGQGSFGSAYLVRCVESKALYVMKEVSVGGLGERERAEARREVEVLSLLRHPNIVTYRESYEAQPSIGQSTEPNSENGPRQRILRIIMDFCDGGDLYKRIATQRTLATPFPEETILDWFAQICLALKHVHDRKILHRDIKSQNVFLTLDGKVKLGDFGIAKVLSGTTDLAKTAIGTPFYLSPEMVEGRSYDRKSDVWALGCVLYEMTTLKHAFQAGDMCNVVLKILRGVYPPVPRNYSTELRALVSTLLRRNPRERPTVDEILSTPLIAKRVSRCLDGVLVVQRALENKRNERFRVTSPAAKYGVPSRSKKTVPVSPVRAKGKGLPRPVHQGEKLAEEFLSRKRQAVANRDRVRGKPSGVRDKEDGDDMLRKKIEAHRNKVKAELQVLQQRIQRGRWNNVDSKGPFLNLHELPLEQTSSMMEATNAIDHDVVFPMPQVTDVRISSETVVLSKKEDGTLGYKPDADNVPELTPESQCPIEVNLTEDPPPAEEDVTAEPIPQDALNSQQIDFVAKSMVAQTMVIATEECAQEQMRELAIEVQAEGASNQHEESRFPMISPETQPLRNVTSTISCKDLVLPPASPPAAIAERQTVVTPVQLPRIDRRNEIRPRTTARSVLRRDTTVPEDSVLKPPSPSEQMMRSQSMPELTQAAVSQGHRHCSCCRHHRVVAHRNRIEVASRQDSEQASSR